MQKLSLNQSLQQRLSPQQIQFIKLLQIPTFELAQRIEEELEINPALEEGMEMDNEMKEKDSDEEFSDEYDDEYGDDYDVRDMDLETYLANEENGYKMQGDGPGGEEDRDTLPIATSMSLTDHLLTQLGFMNFMDKDEAIGKQLIGSIEDDGYIRRPLRSIVNDLAFTQGIYCSIEEVERILKVVQSFDPPGIAARDLQECLLLQLDRKDLTDTKIQTAIRIVDDFFEEFSKKHYDKIQRRLNIDDADMKAAIQLITRLNPKPGGFNDDGMVQYLLPDFILTNNAGKLELMLNSKNAPELRVSRSFHEMLDTYDKSDKSNKSIKETVTFIKQKLDSAKWFIDAIKQRQATLMRTMGAILEYQKEFFFEGDETKLKPMILKDIANQISMDISTVSRVANSKAVQTEFGIFPLKYFFSEGIATDSGEDVSSREVKNILKELIENEPKKNPLSDDKLEKFLNERGYNIARRTVAKYREQLNIPVARLRKQL